MAQQRFLIKKETTPGTPVVTAMQNYRALRVTPGFADEGESFKGRGNRGTTARTSNIESATLSVEAPQCFNALLPVAAGVLGTPVTTQPDIPNAPTAYQHVFTLTGSGERNPVTFTSQWGDSVAAFQMAYTAFQTLTMGVQRSSLTFETSAIAREPDHTITLATVGIVDIPAVPIPSRTYDVFIDNTFAALGTTKMLRCYDMSVAVGDTWGMDTPINSAITSFADLLENEDVDYSGSAQIAFDAAGKALITDFKNGTTKFVRIQATGATIGGLIAYKLMLDFPIVIIGRGEVTTAPNSPRVVLPFNYELTPDPVGGTLINLTLINTVAAL
jgi:hypothetical protein